MPVERSQEAPESFTSAAALHEAHTNLLQRQKDSTGAAEFVDDVEVFLKRGQLTGALLDEENDRLASQAILNYWVTVLDRAGRKAR